MKNVILEFCTWYSNSTSFWKNTGRKEVFVRYCVGSPSESNWFRGDMNIYCIQKNGYPESCSYTEFGEQKPFKTLSTEMQSEYILVVDGNLRDRKFAQTYREFIKWLVRLSKRLGVEEVLVEIKDHAKYSLIQNRNQGNNGEPFSEIFEMVSWVEKRRIKLV